jgi:hypothetical protein
MLLKRYLHQNPGQANLTMWPKLGLAVYLMRYHAVWNHWEETYEPVR